jgi:hypothetical protein
VEQDSRSRINVVKRTLLRSATQSSSAHFEALRSPAARLLRDHFLAIDAVQQTYFIARKSFHRNDRGTKCGTSLLDSVLSSTAGTIPGPATYLRRRWTPLRRCMVGSRRSDRKVEERECNDGLLLA